MSWFANLRISGKLGLSFALLIATVAGVGVLASLRLVAMGEASRHIASDEMPSLVSLMDQNTNASDLRLATIREIQAEAPEQSAARHSESTSVRNLFSKLTAAPKSSSAKPASAPPPPPKAAAAGGAGTEARPESEWTEF